MRKNYHFTEEILTVMYALASADIGLSMDQIVLIVSENTPLNYFDVHDIIERLLQQELLYKYETSTGTYYILNINGKQALGHFITNIRSSVRQSIDRFIKDNYSELKAETELVCDYVPTPDGRYLMILRAYENDECILELALPAPDLKSASEMTGRWTKKAAQVYKSIYDILSAD